MQTVKIVSKKSTAKLYKCCLCGDTSNQFYLDEDYAYCKKCFKKVLSTSRDEEIKVVRYG